MIRTVSFAAGAAALLATTAFGPTIAAAQVRDDPPGWAFQWRGIQAEKGYHPDEAYRAFGGDDGYYYGNGYGRPSYYRYAPRERYRGGDRWYSAW